MLLAAGAREAKLASSDGAVEREGGSGDGSRSERAEIEAGAAIFEAGDVAEDHLDVSKEPMREEHGLGALEMRIGRHHRGFGILCLFKERERPCSELRDGGVDGVTDEEAEVSGDLLVAAATRVELEGDVADFGGEGELDEVVDVLGFRRGDVGGCGQAGKDRVEAVKCQFQLGGRENAGSSDGVGVRFAGSDFLGQKAGVEGKRPLPGLETGIEGCAEAAGPHFGGLFGHRYLLAFRGPVVELRHLRAFA